MKQTLYALLAALSISGLSACSKAYDSDPDTNLSGAGNPIAPIGTADKQQIVCRNNNTKQSYSPAYYLDFGGTRTIYGGFSSGGTSYILQIAMAKYNSTVKHYGADSASITYVTGVPTDQASLKSYMSNNPRKAGYAYVDVAADDNNNMTGTFSGMTYIVDTAGKAIDSVKFSEGSFNVPKQQ
jgi:hypothetical protein